MTSFAFTAGLRPGFDFLHIWPGRPIATHHTSNFFARVTYDRTSPTVVIRAIGRGSSAHRTPECAGLAFFILKPCVRTAYNSLGYSADMFKSLKFCAPERPFLRAFHVWKQSMENLKWVTKNMSRVSK